MNYDIQYRPITSLQTADEKQMGMFLHLSQLASLVVPVAGISPIVVFS